MSIYGERKKELEMKEAMRKQQRAGFDVKKLTVEEREAMVRDMQNFAKKRDEDKNLKLFGSKEAPSRETLAEMLKEGEEGKKDAKFLRDMNKKVYLESDMNLEERLNRNAHYRDRDANRDQ